MAKPIARAVEALDRHGVTYETTPTDTVIEADDLDTLFGAIRDAYEALGDERRVLTELEIDYQPGRHEGLAERVHAVERELGRPPRNERVVASGKPAQHGRSQDLARYEGGRRGEHVSGGTEPIRAPAGGRVPSGRSRRYGSQRY